jgi:hypothetical protein
MELVGCGGGGQERQWKNLFQITDSTDRALFFNSTIIQIGNGKVTPFWEARWVHGPAPKDIAPGLYKAARFKKRSVCDELRNSSWIKNLQVIQDPDLLDEYVQLYMALSTIQLNENKDQIKWKWTPSGQFSVKLAYDCQFHGALCPFPAVQTWKGI